jgi:hypothetical protein
MYPSDQPHLCQDCSQLYFCPGTIVCSLISGEMLIFAERNFDYPAASPQAVGCGVTISDFGGAVRLTCWRDDPG